MTKWRHWPTFDQLHIGSPFGPANKSVPTKLSPPSEPTHDRLQQLFDQMPQAPIGTDAAEKNHLTAGPEHSGTLVERRLWIWHGRNHVIGHDDVERSIGEGQMLCIHYLQLLDVSEGQVGHPPLRFAEHLLRKVDPNYAILWRIAGKRDAGTDTNLENAASHSVSCSDRRLTPALEQGAKDQIVDRRPARIRLP